MRLPCLLVFTAGLVTHGMELSASRLLDKKRYFYGLKIHPVITKDGQPVEFFLSPGAFSDTSALDQFDFDLPPEAWIVGAKPITSTSLKSNQNPLPHAS